MGETKRSNGENMTIHINTFSHPKHELLFLMSPFIVQMNGNEIEETKKWRNKKMKIYLLRVCIMKWHMMRCHLPFVFFVCLLRLSSVGWWFRSQSSLLLIAIECWKHKLEIHVIANETRNKHDGDGDLWCDAGYTLPGPDVVDDCDTHTGTG